MRCRFYLRMGGSMFETRYSHLLFLSGIEWSECMDGQYHNWRQYPKLYEGA